MTRAGLSDPTLAHPRPGDPTTLRCPPDADDTVEHFCFDPRLDGTSDEPDGPPGSLEADHCRFDFLDANGSRDRAPGRPGADSTPCGMAWSGDHPGDRTIGEWSQAGPGSAGGRGFDLIDAATIYLKSGDAGADACPGAADDQQPAAGLFRKLHEASPPTAARLARGLVSMPSPGDRFLGFLIVEELGRGAFGRVFLAKQGELADRLVALKVTAELPGESQTLAQLQHTNIVPIFSAHHAPPLHAVCMPYFGRATLADLLDDVVRQESLPESGVAFVRTVESRRSEASSRASRTSRPADPAPASSLPAAVASLPAEVGRRVPAPVPGVPVGSSSKSLHDFIKFSYVDAVLWMGSRIATGLAHAHDRGILHRDLKPANVLMTDDGQPMILDFNLSEDLKDELGASTAAVGGTLRYMSPEHLERFVGRDVAVAAPSDLFALGVILHELLTGHSPFETHPSCSLPVLHQMIAERRRVPPSARRFNPAITPAVDSIVRHCLQPDPARRYRSALELHEDLERHLANLPLKHAPEPSVRERARKWVRRHPRLGSATTVVVLAGACLAGLASLLAVRSHRLHRLEAAQHATRFHDQVASARFLLGPRVEDPVKRKQGQEQAQRALKRYGVLDDPGWAGRPLMANLTPEAATQVRSDVAEVLLMMTQAATLDAAERPDRREQLRLASSAQRLNQIALASLPAGQGTQAFLAQRAALVRLIGREAEGNRLQAEADKLPLRTANDHYLAAAALTLRGDHRQALPLAEAAVRLDPQHFWSYFILGVCHDHLEHHAEAMTCFTICTAFRPDFADSWLYRGLTYLKREDPERARADFDRANGLRPDWYEPLLNRALAYRNLGDHVKAENDLTRAFALGAPEVRVYFLRAAERRALGDRRGADADLAEGLKREPVDLPSWLGRAMARLETDPEAALADFQSALKLDPRSLPALQMSAYILSDLPGRDEDTIRMLDRLVEAHPNFAPARSGRGVQLAILGRRDEALRDARESLWRDVNPSNLYQVAGIYATTSKTHPEDRLEAYRLLSSALRGGFGFELIDDDRELDAIRDQPEFRQLVDAARGQATERLRRPPNR